MSARSRGEDPYAVAFRKYVGLKSSSASSDRPSSAIALLSPYGVTGLNRPVSSTGLSPAAPYSEQEDEKRKRDTPAALAVFAMWTAPWALTAYVASGFRCPIGSFEIAARWMTASNPSRSSGVTS